MADNHEVEEDTKSEVLVKWIYNIAGRNLIQIFSARMQVGDDSDLKSRLQQYFLENHKSSKLIFVFIY
jgi:hypothetical protein